MFYEFFFRSPKCFIQAIEPCCEGCLASSAIESFGKVPMQLIGIAMSQRSVSADQQRDIHSKSDFNSFNRIQKEQAKTFIKNVQIHDALKCRPETEVIFDYYLWSSAGRIEQGTSRPRIRAYVAFSEGIPVAAQTIVADSLEAGGRSRFVADLHPAAFQQGYLIRDASVRLCVHAPLSQKSL
jgi:hypothetical protein